MNLVGSVNIFGRVAIALFVPFAVAVYLAARGRWSPTKTTVIVLLAGVLLLPSVHAIDWPGVPKLGKREMAVLGATLGLLLTYPARICASPGRAVWIVLIVYPVSAFVTAFTNSDMLQYGPRTLPGLRPYDALAMSINDILHYVLPFHLGRVLCRTSEDVRVVLRAWVAAALLYSVPMLLELRISPQMHVWVYGFFPHSWVQASRGGGFRAQVFLEHGLTLAFFMAVAIVLAAALTRARERVYRIPPGALLLFLFGVLLLDHSLGAAMYAFACIPLVVLTGARVQLLVCTVLVAISISYPMIRPSPLFPDEQIITAIEGINAERAESLAYRFRHERLMLDKAIERFAWGWGGYGRPRIFDPITGADLSTQDGVWIIILGARGYVGMLTTFGLLLWWVVYAFIRIGRFRDKRDARLVAGLGVAVAITGIEMLPNAPFPLLPFFLAGALSRLARELPAQHLAYRSHRS
ncbi:MAG: hypothetical protein V3V08_16770 [Nannocystaceae bacterium]